MGGFAVIAALVLALVWGAAPARAEQARFAWPNGARAAIALTYDDSLQSQLDIAIPQLDAAGLKGTFFLMGRQTTPAMVAGWRAAAAEGHELGNHTVNHPCAARSYDMPVQYTSESYSVEVLLTEVRTMNTMLTALDGKAAHALATPCGQTLVGGADYIAPLRQSGLSTYVRAAAPAGLDPRSIDPFNVPSSFFPDTATGAQLIAAAERARAAGGVLVYGFHGVGGDYLVTSAEAHQQLMSYLAAHRQEYWVATFSEVMDYIAAHAAH